MTEPRMYTADEARQLLDGITPPPWGRLSGGSSVVGIKIDMYDGDDMERANVRLASAAPDLAATVIYQSEVAAEVRDYLQDMADRARRERRHGLAGDLQEAVYVLTEEVAR